MTSLVPTVEIVSNRPVVSSLKIADHFGKEHKNVVRDVRKIISEVSEDFSGLNFEPCDYVGENGKQLPMFWLTKDGFMILVMGYTGKEAMRLKEAYIHRFNVMEQQLNITLPSTAKPVLPLSTTADRKPLDKLVKVWAQQSGIAHAQCWSMVNAYFNINSVSDLPVHWIPDALAFVQDRIDLILEELPKALLAAKDESATLTLFDMAGRINTEICKFRDNLSPLYREVQRVYGNKIHCECTHSHENQARRAAYDSTVHALDVIMNMAWTAQHSLNCLGNLERALK